MIIKYLQLPFYFDTGNLKTELSLLENNAWKLHYQTLHYEGDWKALPLRSVHGNPDDVIIAPSPDSNYQDTVFLKQSPGFQQVLAHFKCPLLAVRLLKLNAGAIIKEHRDADLCYEKGEVRIHIPIVTHEKVEFYLDGERILLKEGECWYMNFNLPHSIINRSDIDRVHLVIDAVVKDWVKDLFNSEDITVKKEAAENNQYDDETKRQMIARLREMNTDTANQMATNLEKEISGL